MNKQIDTIPRTFYLLCFAVVGYFILILEYYFTGIESVFLYIILGMVLGFLISFVFMEYNMISSAFK